MAGSNCRPPRYKHVALPTELMELFQTSLIFKNKIRIIAVRSLYTTARIRTLEAYAVELKSTPFDRSGTVAVCISSTHYIYIYILISKYFI